MLTVEFVGDDEQNFACEGLEAGIKHGALIGLKFAPVEALE